MIRAQNFSVSYLGSSEQALNNLSFEIVAGQRIAIMGESESGKSTLLKSFIGLLGQHYLADISGKLWVANQEITKTTIAKLVRQVGYLAQDPSATLIGRSVAEDLAFGPANLGMPIEVIKQTIIRCLKIVGLEGFENRLTAQLSGGESQRLAIANCLATDPSILALDDPTAQLDQQGKCDLIELLTELSQKHTIILSTHDSEMVRNWATRVLVLKKGQLIWDGAPQQLFEQPKKIQDLGLRELNSIQSPIESPLSNEPLVQLVDLEFSYPNEDKLLKQINLTVTSGGLVALTGNNGSGKTTLAKLLIGLLKPTQGKIIVSDSVGFVFQHPDQQIFADTVAKEVSFALKNKGINDNEVTRQTEIILKKTGLEKYAQLHPLRLSRAKRQILAIAGAIILKPKLLILDEPTSGLDGTNFIKVCDLIKNLVSQGVTVLAITHDTQLINLSYRRIHLVNGQVVDSG